MNIQELFDKYLNLVETAGPVECGDLVSDLDDEVCKELYNKLVSDPRTKDFLVKSLWYNYNTQKMRW